MADQPTPTATPTPGIIATAVKLYKTLSGKSEVGEAGKDYQQQEQKAQGHGPNMNYYKEDDGK